MRNPHSEDCAGFFFLSALLFASEKCSNIRNTRASVNLRNCRAIAAKDRSHVVMAGKTSALCANAGR
ncbi:hypothetical protein [Cupriavidus basilensis]|uniref:hypothetical protein n=1 Tax=Cupriavidus basilensis TaxID=68895 RepID=UPI0012DFFFBD|nr:hypothetical protein [Cupriavidus basilensis]